MEMEQFYDSMVDDVEGPEDVDVPPPLTDEQFFEFLQSKGWCMRMKKSLK